MSTPNSISNQPPAKLPPLASTNESSSPISSSTPHPYVHKRKPPNNFYQRSPAIQNLTQQLIRSRLHREEQQQQQSQNQSPNVSANSFRSKSVSRNSDSPIPMSLLSQVKSDVPPWLIDPSPPWGVSSVADLEALDAILDQLAVQDTQMRAALLKGPLISFETIVPPEASATALFRGYQPISSTAGEGEAAAAAADDYTFLTGVKEDEMGIQNDGGAGGQGEGGGIAVGGGDLDINATLQNQWQPIPAPPQASDNHPSAPHANGDVGGGGGRLSNFNNNDNISNSSTKPPRVPNNATMSATAVVPSTAAIATSTAANALPPNIVTTAPSNMGATTFSVPPSLIRSYLTMKVNQKQPLIPAPPPAPTAELLVRTRPPQYIEAPSYDELSRQIKDVQRQYTCGTTRGRAPAGTMGLPSLMTNSYISGIDGPLLEDAVRISEEPTAMERTRPKFVAMRKSKSARPGALAGAAGGEAYGGEGVGRVVGGISHPKSAINRNPSPSAAL